MERCFHFFTETLRKWTPGFQTDRVCVKDYVIQPTKKNEQPIYLEKGCLILIPTAGLHYDPKYFPNPKKFDPDRFSEENRSSIVPGSYMPFGLGPRNCIGEYTSFQGVIWIDYETATSITRFSCLCRFQICTA